MVCCPSCHKCFSDGKNELLLCNECVRASHVKNQVFFEKGLWEKNKKFSLKEKVQDSVVCKKRITFPLNIPRDLHTLLWSLKGQDTSINKLIINAIIDKYQNGGTRT